MGAFSTGTSEWISGVDCFKIPLAPLAAGLFWKTVFDCSRSLDLALLFSVKTFPRQSTSGTYWIFFSLHILSKSSLNFPLHLCGSKVFLVFF